ncbi:MAG: SDR family oxidoreductase [Rhodospirillales bacterium]|nr:SDR family oxidoreductase [Rhodospirillales bacterium]
MVNSKKSLFCFGPGFSLKALARQLLNNDWSVSGTYREADGAENLAALGIDPIPFNAADAAMESATAIISTVPPSAEGDPVLARYGDQLANISKQAWIGYLSTTGVYGDTGGALVDEASALNPSNDRSQWRATCEQGWLSVSAHIFRLSGIYGQGRSSVDRLRLGLARRIDNPGHLFSRIHVDDIAQTLIASINQPSPGQIYNLCDDEAAEQQVVEAYAAELLGIEPPPLVPFDEAIREMSPIAKTFWQDNRRVDNARIKNELGVKLIYPTYREGLTAIYQSSSRTG